MKSAEIEGVRLFATKWIDDRSVHILSTLSAGDSSGTITRYDRKVQKHETITVPGAILDNNSHMGHVDEINSYLGRFRMTTQTRKRAHIKIFLHFVNIKYRDDALMLKEPKKEIRSLFDFKLEVAYGLTMRGTNLKQGGRRSDLQKELDRRAQKKSTTLLPTVDIRLDITGHWPAVAKERGPSCTIPACTSRPKTYCVKCNTYLCINQHNCFMAFPNVEFQF